MSNVAGRALVTAECGGVVNLEICNDDDNKNWSIYGDNDNSFILWFLVLFLVDYMGNWYLLV